MNMDAQQQKHVYAVLGMARSGTSAIARGLKALGIELGEKLEPANPLWNPKGFWEDVDIVYKINRAVLSALNYTWMSVNLMEEQCRNNPTLTGINNLAIELLKQRTTSVTHWGFKDPRTAKILPFWQDVFDNLHLQDHYVIALRNPLSSAYSYQRVSGVDLEVGMLLWLMHLIPAIEGTHGKDRMMVSYDLMLQQPREQLQRIKKHLALPDLAPDSEMDVYANEFLDKNLHHFECSDADLAAHSATLVAPLCSKIYHLLMRIAKDEITFASDEFKSGWEQIMQEFARMYPIYGYLDVVLKRNKQLERNLRTIHKSIPWKLTFPLRFIDDLLRSKRRKTRQQRRLAKEYA